MCCLDQLLRKKLFFNFNLQKCEFLVVKWCLIDFFNILDNTYVKYIQ